MTGGPVRGGDGDHAEVRDEETTPTCPCQHQTRGSPIASHEGCKPALACCCRQNRRVAFMRIDDAIHRAFAGPSFARAKNLGACQGKVYLPNCSTYEQRDLSPMLDRTHP